MTLQNKKIAILATGDEITQGSVLNTNAKNMAHELFSHGLEMGWQISVSDDINAIEVALEILSREHAVIITIGGLGPTSDDKTRFALANYLKEPLVVDSHSMENLAARYQAMNMPFTELSQQQALFPQNAEILVNLNGSANGCCYQKENTQSIFMLPGPPRECLPMFETYVLPRLINQYATEKTLLQWKVFGVAEGVIAEKVDITLKSYAHLCRTSFRWEYPYVDCKVLLDDHAQEKEKITLLLDELLLPYQLDSENHTHNKIQTATEQLKNYLTHVKQPIYIQDYATGGVLESRLRTSLNHQNLFFSLSPPENSLSFQIDGLKNYWCGEEGTESELILTSPKGSEIIKTPFRKVHLEEYAAELIAHKIYCLCKER